MAAIRASRVGLLQPISGLPLEIYEPAKQRFNVGRAVVLYLYFTVLLHEFVQLLMSFKTA